MQKQVLNYRIIIEPEKMGKKTVYNAYCPTLRIADFGDSIDEVLKSIKDGIELALEYLRDEGKEIPGRELPEILNRPSLLNFWKIIKEAEITDEDLKDLK